MAEADWTYLSGGLSASEVKRGATAGIAVPSGGGVFTFGMNSVEIVDGVVALHTNQVNFVPMAKGGSVRGAVKRGVSGAATGFAPFLFIGLGGTGVSDSAYLLGLADGDPHRIALRKGALSGGLPDNAVDPDASPNILMRSSDTYDNDTWLHLRLDMIVQGTGDVILQCFQNDLDSNTVSSPTWQTIPGMEGPQSPTVDGFIDDALGVNTGSAPYTSGRAGFGAKLEDVTRRVFFDHLEIARQL